MSFFLPTQTPLRISQYDPEKLKQPRKLPKRPPTVNHALSNVDTQTGAHRNLQESELRVLTDQAPRLPIAETPSNTPGPEAREVTSHNNVQGMTADPLRRGSQDPPSFAGTRVSPELHTVDLHTLGTDSDHPQVGSVENSASDIGLPSHPDSLFGDFELDYYLTEQEARPGVENNGSCAATHNTDTPDDQTNDLGVWGEFEASNTLGSSTHRVVEQRRTAKRRRSQNDSLVVIDSSGNVTSESDVESVFENSSSKQSKSGSWVGSQGSSIYCSDNKDIATPTTHLRIHSPIPVMDLAERQNNCSSTKLHDTSNPVYNIDPKIDTEDSDSNNGDKLSHSPSWYRFKPSTATIEGSCTIIEAGHCYVMLVEDVFHNQEFHRVLGKEYIDGEVHYLVDWVATLVQGHVLQKAKAQPLISQFEASCEAQREKKKRVAGHRLNGPEVTDGKQRKRQGRTRNML